MPDRPTAELPPPSVVRRSTGPLETRSTPASAGPAPLRRRRPGALWSPVVRSLAFVRKELAEIIRQPRLLLLLVGGPFLLLVLFGAGYSNEQLKLRTVFVGPPDSFYEQTVDQYADELSELVDWRGYETDEAAARAALDDDEVDLVVIFPADPASSILAGEQAVIRVVHQQLNPLHETAINVLARLAVQEVNATVLSSVVGEVQARAAPAVDLADSAADVAAQLAASSQVDQAAPGLRDELVASLADLETVLDSSASILDRMGSVDPEVLGPLTELRDRAGNLRERAAAATLDPTGSPDDVDALAAEVRELADTMGEVTALPPDVLVRPFVIEAENALPQPVEPADYFTPGALALLLQHLALTFAALSLVRDRRSGLFEMLRVGPLSSVEILVGKTVAFLIVGVAVAAALVAASVYVLDMPLEGEVGWLALIVVGVVLASIVLGMALAALSSTESQAVQFAMLSLLAGLFFSGLVLGLDELAYPVKVISWLLPVTYGIRALQSIMLRGDPPSTDDILGLGALIVGYGAFATLALMRKLRRA